MARRAKLPSTPALRSLASAGVAFTPHRYDYVERGGTAASSAALGVPEHAVIKTLVFETDARKPLLVLMHGDAQVSTKALARQLGVKAVQPCDPVTAQRHSGYKVGGTSPFGTRRAMPVCLERSVLELPRIWINGGARGLLVELEPAALSDVLDITLVDAARPG